MKYDVFISYSRLDSEIADNICDILKENGITYFIDTEDISGGEEFSPVLAENIGNCTLFLFLGSKNSYHSKWTPKELHFALNHKDSIAIIPYLIDDEPLPHKIEFAIADLNVRNIKDHPIDTILLDDIKNAKEKLSIRTGKEDLKMAKAIAETILSSKHDKDYCVDLLTKLGENKLFRGMNSGYTFPNESLHYFTSALTLLKGMENADDKYSKLDSRIASINSKIAKILYSQEKYEEAVSYLEQAIEKYRNLERSNSGLTDCLLSLCDIYLMKEEYVKAEQLCVEIKNTLAQERDLFIIDNKVLRMSKMLEEALIGQQKQDQAEKVQDEVLVLFRSRKDKDDFVSLLIEFANANIHEEKFEQAEKKLREVLELDVENAEACVKLADVLERNNKYEEAKNTYEKAFQLTMSHTLNRVNSHEFLNLHKQITSFFERNNNFEEIEKYFELAISKYNIDIYRNEIGKSTIGSIYERYADWLTNHQQFNKSSRYLKKCMELTKGMKNQESISNIMFSTLTKRTVNYFCLGYRELALSDINDALKIIDNSTNIAPNKDLYSIWKKFKDINFIEGAGLIRERIVQSFKTFKIDNSLSSARYLTEFGWRLLLMEEYEAARKPLEEALRIELKLKRDDVNINNAKNNLGRLYIYTGEYDKAEKILNEALPVLENISIKDKKILHFYAESQNYLGRLRMKQNRFVEAEDYFEKSLENYKKAAKLDNKWKDDVKETTLLLEQAKALQED